MISNKVSSTGSKCSGFQTVLHTTEAYSSFDQINSLKLKLVEIIFNNSVLTAKKTQLFTITDIKWLTLFKEIIAV
jgi:hypothetical protein